MSSRDVRPPTDYVERARSLVRVMRSSDIDVLSDGTTLAQLESFIQQSWDVANDVGIITDALRAKQEERNEISRIIWRVTKSGVAFIASRFGDDAVQLEQVGRKRRSKYARRTRKAAGTAAAPIAFPDADMPLSG